MASKHHNNLSSLLIPLVSKIREVFEETNCSDFTDLELPQIVVVGSQSAGKSSVLENIVGHSILPRGVGIVTRVPLVLSLHCPNEQELSSASKFGSNEWGEFLHLPNEKFFSFDKIRSIISERTIELAGNDRGVLDSPIHLKICSPHLLDLTLVDLPGMTRVPVGDQPSDIEMQIRKLCLKYIERKSSIILAITAANTDLSNSDALQLAKQVDPKGERTVGVLTKIDLMDLGTNCLEILKNRVYPLALGYVAVVNRGQQDIDQSVGIEVALNKEKAFFESHDTYGSHARRGPLVECFGTEALVSCLVVQLHGCIVNALPNLRQQVRDARQNCENELSSLGEPILEKDMKRYCLDQIAKFTRRIYDSLEGNVDSLCGGDELTAVAEIIHVFDLFYDSLRKIDPLEGLNEEHILKTIKNSDTMPPSMLLPEKAYHSLVKEQIARLELPGTQCVDLVHERLLAVVSREQRHHIDGSNRFPHLMKRIDSLVAAFLVPLCTKCKEKIEETIDFELAYIHTTSSSFAISQKKLIPLISKVLGVSQPTPIVQNKDIQEEEQSNNERVKLESPNGGTNRYCSHDADDEDKKSDNQGPFWKGWFGGNEEDEVGSHTVAHSSRPRRGGRRSSFGISQCDIDAFRNELAATSSSTSQPSFESSLSEKERASVDLVKEMIKSYFAVVSQGFCDKVPKTIMAVMVNHLKQNIQTELITALYEDATMVELMSEPVEVSQRRNELKSMRNAFTKADMLLNDIPLSFALPINTDNYNLSWNEPRGVLSPMIKNNTNIPLITTKKKHEAQINKENQQTLFVAGKGSAV